VEEQQKISCGAAESDEQAFWQGFGVFENGLGREINKLDM